MVIKMIKMLRWLWSLLWLKGQASTNPMAMPKENSSLLVSLSPLLNNRRLFDCNPTLAHSAVRPGHQLGHRRVLQCVQCGEFHCIVVGSVVGTWAVLEGKVGISSSPAWTLHRAHILLNKHTHLIHVLGTLYIYVFYFLNEIIYHLNLCVKFNECSFLTEEVGG